MIYTIIECVSKSIDMEELKTITIDIVSRIFSSDEVTIVLPMRDGHYRIVSRSSSDGTRKKANSKSPILASAIARWQNGKLFEKEVSSDRVTVYLPLSKGDVSLALIEVCSPQTPFTEEKLRFMDAVRNPIAIAFENARLYTIAITDELTGLYSVRHFRTCLDRQLNLFKNHGGKFALLIIDIDDFKSVNDTYGHPVGDSVLKRVSWVIAEAVRESDQVFRYGGEEFAVLLTNTGQTEGLFIADRIRIMVGETVINEGDAQINRTVSIGLALYPENANTLRDMVVEADNALYSAKRSGKNRVVKSEKVADS
jgi:diguanylate cyclase (GGDEF)-like protein